MPGEPHRVHLPRLTTEGWCHSLFERLQRALSSASDVLLDAGDVVWISPFGTSLLADFVLRILEAGRAVSMALPRHPRTAEYIKTCGLLRLTQSSDLKDAITPNNLELRLLKQMEGAVPEAVAAFVAGQASNVGDDERSLLRVWITELMTNANDHAKSQRGFWICARYNPLRNDIRICVADSGIGIKQSLLNSGKYGQGMTHVQALEKALEEGVTSRPGHTGGLGLKHIAAYVKAHGGSLSIFSGDARIKVARKKKVLTKLSTPHQGTIVAAAFDASTMETFASEATESPFRFE